LTALEAALDARLLTELRGPVPRFRFAHALVQTSLYEDITQLRRIRLHRRVGEAVEAIYGSRVSEHLSELAHHFAQVVAPGAADHASRRRDAERQAHAALGRSAAVRPWLVTVGQLDQGAADLLAEALDLIATDDSPLRVRVLGGLARELYFEHIPARREELSL